MTNTLQSMIQPINGKKLLLGPNYSFNIYLETHPIITSSTMLLSQQRTSLLTTVGFCMVTERLQTTAFHKNLLLKIVSSYSEYTSSHDSDNATKNTANSSTTNYYDSFSPFSMPELQRIAWIAIFSILVIVATVGNSIVVWIVLGE